MLNHFETLELAGKLVDLLAAGASVARDPETLRRLIVDAQDARTSADAAVALAREEPAAADAKLKELEVAGRNHTEWVERTTKELNQRRSDLDENTAIVAQREHIVGEREREVAEEKRKVEAAKAAVRAHIGEAA
jgi:hypothetical protein